HLPSFPTRRSSDLNAVSNTWTSKNKKITTPVIRWATQDHIPSFPRYRVPLPDFFLAGGDCCAVVAVDTMKPPKVRNVAPRPIISHAFTAGASCVLSPRLILTGDEFVNTTS